MISHPENWKSIGQPVSPETIESTLLKVLQEVGTKNLALSGGIDSSFLLFQMTKLWPAQDIRTFTIALNNGHPDYTYARVVANFFEVQWDAVIPTEPLPRLPDDCPGDEVVREFFSFLSREGVSSIICGDGIDEFMCGYYRHTEDPTEETYYDFLQRLVSEHLIPLHRNSGDIQIHLPYLDGRLTKLYSMIPLSHKCDKTSRKKVMVDMAKGKMPPQVLSRRKYGFCDAMRIKKSDQPND